MTQENNKKDMAQSNTESTSPKLERVKKEFFSTTVFSKVVMIGIIILLANIVMGRLFFRLDLTESSQYSLAPATKKILVNMDDMVNIEAYFSSNVPERIVNIRNQLRDLLEEFRARSNGKVEFRFIDPGEDQTIRQKLRMRGIPEVNLNVFEKDKASVSKAFLGMVILYQDKTESIPVIDRLDNMEYQMVSIIKRLTSKVKPTIGYTVGKGEKDFSKELSPLLNLLKKQYNLKSVELAKGTVADEIKTLVMLGPEQAYTEKEIYYLDQFVLRGGKIFFALDKVGYDAGGQMGLQGKVYETGLDKFLEHLGVKIDKNLVMDLQCAQAPFRTQYGTIVQPYPLWPRLSAFNKDNVIVNRLDTLVLQWASSLTLIKRDKVNAEILASTSPKAWAQEGFFNLDPQFSQPPRDKPMKNYNMAVMLRGQYESFFKGKTLPEGVIALPKSHEVSPQVQHIVLGDSDFISYAIQSRQNPGNINFFLNTIDYLTIGDELIGIRSKQILDRPIEPLSDTLRSVLKTLTIVTMPLIVILIGLMNYFRRRNQRRMYEQLITNA